MLDITIKPFQNIPNGSYDQLVIHCNISNGSYDQLVIHCNMSVVVKYLSHQILFLFILMYNIHTQHINRN